MAMKAWGLFVLVNFVDGADVRVVQGRSGLGFALETGQRLRVFGDFIGQEFQGHEAAQLEVLSLIDHAHAATAELFDRSVVRDSLPDHWRRIVRG
jgi:hypothetical protein